VSPAAAVLLRLMVNRYPAVVPVVVKLVTVGAVSAAVMVPEVVMGPPVKLKPLAPATCTLVTVPELAEV
jgi:hypothetical protein